MVHVVVVVVGRMGNIGVGIHARGHFSFNPELIKREFILVGISRIHV